MRENVDALDYVDGGKEPLEFELFLLMSHSQAAECLGKLELCENKLVVVCYEIPL